VEDTGSQHYRRDEDISTHPRSPSKPVQARPTPPRRRNENVGSAAPTFAHIESGKQPSLTRGQACRPSVDNIMIAITYTSIVLALYWFPRLGSWHYGQRPICTLFAPESGTDIKVVVKTIAPTPSPPTLRHLFRWDCRPAGPWIRLRPPRDKSRRVPFGKRSLFLREV
jgi:hypothetical protein